METTKSSQYLRKRKFLLVLPLLVMPFVTLAFWAMDGGKGKMAMQDQTDQAGLNNKLPEANLGTESLDKMSLYRQAEKDSMERNGSLPGYQDTAIHGAYSSGNNSGYSYNSGGYPSSYTGNYPDPNEEKVKAKLADLERAMNQSSYSTSNPAMGVASSYVQQYGTSYGSPNNELSQMEARLKALSAEDSEDPELQQINVMLEKIMDIQNPERTQQKLKTLSAKDNGRVFSVGQLKQQHQADLLKAGMLVKQQPDFYDLDNIAAPTDTLLQTTIPAEVHGTQTIVSGEAIKLRLTEAVYLNGQMIPSGTFVSGICSVSGERLKIEITGIRSCRSIYPVAMTAYDMDAIEGIRIPDAITRDAAKEGADQAVQSMQLMSLDPSIATQAAGAGVGAVKGLFGKKVKLVRVTVKAGHPVLLVNAK